jgi:hypothetical protein
MEPIAVNARFDSQGRAIPQSFLWQEREYLVQSIGRRWDDERGQHILVMYAGGQTAELLFAPAEGGWFMKKIGPRKMLV